MPQRPAKWYLNVAIGSTVAAVLMVPAMEWLQHEHFPWWVHIPATAVVLGVISMGAMAAGVAFVEYRSRSASGGQQAQ